ncbi:MAG: cytochrome c oxidase assembly protein [Gammaproteobacteria bacterium]
MPLKTVLSAAVFLQMDAAKAHETAFAAETWLPDWFGGLILIGLWLAYQIGSRRVWPKTGQRLIFHGTCLMTALTAFVPPTLWLGNGAALHMVQHMLILVLIAPLFVLSRPLPQWLAASGRWAVRLWKPLLRLGRFPLGASCLQGVLIWFWHAPKFYNLALTNPWWHLAEHASFALGAGLFWWSIMDRAADAAVPALLFTLMHTGMLGAVLAFAQKPLYGDLIDLQDQQLAGLIMWVPGGLAYLIAGIGCSLRWFDGKRRDRPSERGSRGADS